MDPITLENKIGVYFKNENLLKEALTHRSYLNENPDWRLPHNERLEFLGDAVLELITTKFLWEKYPEAEEGQLTLYRAALVNTKRLAVVAEEIGIRDHLLISKGEAQTNGKATETILADMFEALTGAIYLDQGYAVAETFIHKVLLPHLTEIEENRLYKDPKSDLQEIAQADYKITPTYQIIEESGPDHNKVFKVGVFFGEELKAEGLGSSKQEAETSAAKFLLEKFSSKNSKS